MKTDIPQYTAFVGPDLLISGPLDNVALEVRHQFILNPSTSVLVFADRTGNQLDLDLRGSAEEMLERLHHMLNPPSVDPTKGGPGRPKLGVVSREISLLPRHWEWLAKQTGGSSSAIRRLIEEAAKNPSPRERIKVAQERAHSFMSACAVDFENYEESLRAIYAREKRTFKDLIQNWPKDIRMYAKKLAKPIW